MECKPNMFPSVSMAREMKPYWPMENLFLWMRPPDFVTRPSSTERSTEVNQGAVAAGGNALHLDQGTTGARTVHLHRKRPHVHSRAVQLFQLALEHGFVEFFRAIHVLHVDLEPDGRIL